MPLQSTFTNVIPQGYPGMVAGGDLQNRTTRTCEDAAGIAFGKAVFRGVGDHGVTGTPTAGKCLGISMVDHGNARLTASPAVDTYDQFNNVPIMQRGTIWVTSASTTNDGDQVYVTAGGAFTNVSTSNVILAGWFFVDTLAAPGVARITNNIQVA